LITINSNEIHRVLLEGSGWQVARSVSFVELGPPFALKGKTVPGIVFQGENGWTYAQHTMIRALATSNRILTAEDLAEREAEREAAEDRQFEWQHRAPRAVYQAAAMAQNGVCGKCGASLADFGITHYDELSKKVLCQVCTPYAHRYGSN
jgi:hypothetical protein